VEGWGTVGALVDLCKAGFCEPAKGTPRPPANGIDASGTAAERNMPSTASPTLRRAGPMVVRRLPTDARSI